MGFKFFKVQSYWEKKIYYDYHFLAPLLTQTATQTLKLCYFIRTHLSNETQWVALLW